MNKLFLLLAIVTLLITNGTFAQKTWTGTSSTVWNTANNWSPSGIPTSSDDVIIPVAPTNQPVISGSTGVCKNLTINAGASLGISATTLNNASLMASGNATISGALTIGGQVAKTGKLTVVNITWVSGSSMSGFFGGSIEVSGNWEFSPGSSVSMGFSSVNFTGTSNSEVFSKSSSSSFSTVSISKTNSSSLYISNTSTATLNFNGTVTINTGATLIGSGNITTIFTGNLYNTGHFSFNTGTVSFEKNSGTQAIQVNTSDFFNNMTINAGGTVTINNTLNLLDNLTINSGIFDPLGNTVILFGDWDNNIGVNNFTEGNGRVIFAGGNYHQYSSTENFNILEVNKTIGGSLRVNTGTVTCNQYDWTAGSIDVLNNGTFTALDLADDGIRGNYYINTGCTINLHQDNNQYVDLAGNLTFTGGGTINVYGGMGWSQWPNYANASITMSGGTLDFVDQGIAINNLAPFTLTTDITGGIIRTSKGFFCSRTDFNPAGGTVKLYGTSNSTLDVTNGSLWNLEIDKNTVNNVTLNADLTVNGNLTVNNGTLSYINKVITLGYNLNINNGGVFLLGMAAQLKLANTRNIYINSGGTLKTEGTGADNAVITHSAGYYNVTVMNNGTFSARNTYFSYLNFISFQVGSVLDPANAFYRCTFTNNSNAPAGSLLYFANDQVVSIHEANFPVVNSLYNIYKSNNAGRVYFKDATGAYAGPIYEYDPNNRIDWVASTPGLWTGIVSADWYDANNWDDFNVPTATTNVTIPSGTAYSPVIGAGTAYCKKLALQTGVVLTQNTGSSFYVGDDFDTENGQFIMNGTSYIYFSGSEDASWTPGTSDIYNNVRILKDDSYLDNVVLYYDIACSGTFEIREGTFSNHGAITVNNTGTSAFKTEAGGQFLMENDLTVLGNVHFYNGSVIESFESTTIKCGKDLIVEETVSGAQIYFLVMNGSGIQYIDIRPGNNIHLGHLSLMKPDGICYIKSGDLTIDEYVILHQGTLSAFDGPSHTASFDINMNGPYWVNHSTGIFEPGFGRVVFSGNNTAYCENITFNILEVDKSISTLEIRDNITCAAYDWTSGSVKTISGGTFTANDLLDNAIKGSFTCEEGGIINLTNSGTGTFVDLAGELHNFGGTINISGSICYWPYNGNAVVEMTGGVIDLKTCGLNINSNAFSLNDNITGGTISTAYGFSGNRADFSPTHGIFEFYGTSNVTISQSNGCKLSNVFINKSTIDGENQNSTKPIYDERTGEMISDGSLTNTVSLSSEITLNNGLTIQAGILNSQNNAIFIRGNWNNLVGPDGFIEGSGRVIFTLKSADIQRCSSETFNILEIDKGYTYLSTESGTSISCQVYDWTSGGLGLYYSSFYAADLADNGVYGDFDVRVSTIELHQDAAQGVDFVGSIFIMDSEFKVYGGNDQSNWGTYGNANLRMWGGVLDFVDQGINIQEVAPYTFTSHYDEEGVIRTQKFFTMHSPDNDVWTVELYGNQNGMVAVDNGSSVYNLKISKPQLPVFTNLLSSKITGGLFIEHGTTIVVAGNTVQCGYLWVHDGGDFRMASANLDISYTNIVVDSGGYFYTEGNEAAKSKISTVEPDESFNFWVNPGATILANNTIFENLDYPGISIPMGATVIPYQAFKNCEFINGGNGSLVYTLLINNDQDLVIENAVFSFMGSWDDHNVSKWNDAGSVVMVNASGAYAGPAWEHDQYNRIHWTGQLGSQTITIPAGWSGLSSFLQPAPENDIQNLFAPVLPDFTILLNNTGMYYPASGINTLSDWMSQDAFKVKMENETTLTLDGGWELNKTFEMNAGWNLMPVIFNDSWDVPFAAQQLGTSLVIIKEVAGSKVYWPQYGINTLYWLIPGKAYYVLLNSAGAVTFPQNDVKADVLQIPEKPNINSPWGKIQATAGAHLIAIPAELLAGYPKGTVIGVFTSEGTFAGFETITDIARNVAITAYADDPTTDEKEGFSEEEVFIMKIFNPETGKENTTQMEFDEQMPQNRYFVNNGVSALKGLNITGISDIIKDRIEVSVSPNPSDGVFNIGPENENLETTWLIFNMHGSMVLSGEETGDFSINMTSYPKGIYNLKISQGGLQVVEKLVLR